MANNNHNENRQRTLLFTVAITALFAILLVRLFALQIVEGDVLAEDSSANSIRVIVSAAPRGEITSADGTVLADNQVVFAITVAASQISNRQQLAEDLAWVMDDPQVTAEDIMALLAANARQYEPTVIKRYTYEEGLPIISRVEENRQKLPGVVVVEEARRRYPQGSLAGHLLGTVGAISQEEYAEKQAQGYLITDWLGKSGLEKTMEQTESGRISYGLRGESGIEQIEVTATAKAVRTIYKQDPVPGDKLLLTIDSQVQQAMEESLARIITAHAQLNSKCVGGAAVLLNVKTGAVIAMSSFPVTDPNDFVDGLSAEKSAYYWDEQLTPTLNRAISAAYPPGSTFKPITAIAALSSGVTVEESVYCGSSVWSGKSGKARCTGIHGNISFYTAMARSCNSYFQEMGARAGIDNIDAIARQLGLGKPTGIQLPGEVSGLVPDPQWKSAHFSGWEQDWHDYDTWYTAIGQGYTTVTPLQMAAYVAAVANDGIGMQPYLVEQVSDQTGQLLWEHQPQPVNLPQVEPEILAEVRKGMLLVASAGGTAYGALKDLPVQAAAKTGTAQTGLPGDGNDDTHGVFIAFAPYDDPQVAFSCVIEYGKSGSSTAAYVARDVLSAYFRQ